MTIARRMVHSLLLSYQLTPNGNIICSSRSFVLSLSIQTWMWLTSLPGTNEVNVTDKQMRVGSIFFYDPLIAINLVVIMRCYESNGRLCQRHLSVFGRGENKIPNMQPLLFERERILDSLSRAGRHQVAETGWVLSLLITSVVGSSSSISVCQFCFP